MAGWPAGALADRLSVSCPEEGLRSILGNDCLEVSWVICRLCRGIGGGRNSNGNTSVLPYRPSITGCRRLSFHPGLIGRRPSGPISLVTIGGNGESLSAVCASAYHIHKLPEPL